MRIPKIILCSSLLLLLFACKEENITIRNKKTFKDYYSRQIILPDNIERVISMYYVQAEIICALGAQNMIIGIGKIDENSSVFLKTFFPELMKLPQIGISNIDYERIISLKPDLIFSGIDKSTIERLENLGFKAVAMYPESLNEIVEEIKYYGTILGKDQQAQRLYNYYNDLINKIKEISVNIPLHKRPKVYYMRVDALTTIGGNMLGEIIELAGGMLITNGVGNNSSSLQMSLEDIYNFNPDLIIIRDRASINPEEIYNDVKWKDISAIKNKRIYKEHSGWTEFRLETIFGIVEKAKWIQPELFNDFNAEMEYDKFIEIVKLNSK